MNIESAVPMLSLRAPIPATEDITKVAAWIPMYTDERSVVRTYFADGSICDVPCKVRTLIKHIAAHHGASPDLLRKRHTQERRLCMPLALGDTVLVPLRVRRPRIARDETLGYVNLRHIRDCYASHGDAPTRLVLSCADIPVYWRRATVVRHIETAVMYLPPVVTDPLYPVALRLAQLLHMMIDVKQQNTAPAPTPLPSHTASADTARRTLPPPVK